jgi:signal transduction histidine kinase
MFVVDGGPNDGRTIILAKPTITMGRLPANDLVVNEPAVSRRHAEITHSETGYFLRDLETTNGTFVNQQDIGKEEYQMKEGDRVCLARTDTSFIFTIDSSKTIQIPKSSASAPGAGFIEGLGRLPGSRQEQAAALQENLRQLESAYQQASNYAQQLDQELTEETQQEQESIQRRVAQEAREDERKKLAEELHDETMADLAAMALEVGLLRRHASQGADSAEGDSSEVQESLADLGTRLKDTNLRLRQMVQGMFPSVLTNLGLITALRSYFEELSKRPIDNPYPLKIELKVQGFEEERLPEEVEINLYRVTQQGVTNAIQHAQAKNLLVELCWQDAAVLLSIVDDGVGFDVANPKESTLTGHFGMTNLKERIEAVEGTLEVISKESEGTKLHANVPVELTTPRSTEVSSTTYRLRPPPPSRANRRE